MSIELDTGSYVLTGYSLSISTNDKRFTEAVDTSFDGDNLEVFWAVDLLFDDPNKLYFWSGIGEIEIGGNTYTGAGELLGISEIRESSDIAAYGATLTLSGIPSNLINRALTEPYQGREAVVKFGVKTSDGTFTTSTLFRGYMDQMNISYGPETLTIALEVESRLIDLQRPRIKRYAAADHKVEFPLDEGLDFVNQIQQQKLEWKG